MAPAKRTTAKKPKKPRKSVDETPPNPIGFLRGTVVTDHGLVEPEHDVWVESKSDPSAKTAK